MYRNLWGLLAIFVLGFALVGLTFNASLGQNAEFTYISASEPKSLDPHIMTGQLEGRFGDALFEGLTYRHPRSLQPTPGSAESWDVSPDGRTYTFKIRQGLAWSDGVPLNAHDFAWSWRRLQNPALGSEYAYILHMVKYAEEFNTYSGQVERLDGKLIPALQTLISETGDGQVEPAAWQRWLADNKVTEIVKGTSDPVIRAALVERTEALDGTRLAALAEALTAERGRRQSAFDEASARFGVDGGIYAQDDHTLVIELKAPTPYFLELTCFYSSYPVPRHKVEKRDEETGEVLDDEWAHDWFLPENIVTNGPFELHDWLVNERIRLVKSEKYWNKDSIRVASIDALPIENKTTALNLYLRGNVDWNTDMPPEVLSVLKERPDFYAREGFIVYYYRFNCTRKPFDDPRVRKAIAMAIDRDSIVRNVGQLGQPPAYHLVPPGIPGYEPPPSGISYDPEEAKRLLAEAGYPNGDGIEEIDLLFNTSESHRQIAELVADQLRRTLGITIKARNQEWQAYQATTLAMEYDIARAGWIGDYLDPNTFLDLWVTNGGNNQTGFSNATYDDLIRYAGDPEQLLLEDPEAFVGRLKEPDRARPLLEAFQNETDPTARRKAGEAFRLHLFREAEAILMQDEVPIMPIYFYVTSNMVKDRVGGWHADIELEDGTVLPNVKDIHPLRGIYIKSEGD